MTTHKVQRFKYSILSDPSSWFLQLATSSNRQAFQERQKGTLARTLFLFLSLSPKFPFSPLCHSILPPTANNYYPPAGRTRPLVTRPPPLVPWPHTTPISFTTPCQAALDAFDQRAILHTCSALPHPLTPRPSHLSPCIPPVHRPRPCTPPPPTSSPKG